MEIFVVFFVFLLILLVWVVIYRILKSKENKNDLEIISFVASSNGFELQDTKKSDANEFINIVTSLPKWKKGWDEKLTISEVFAQKKEGDLDIYIFYFKTAGWQIGFTYSFVLFSSENFNLPYFYLRPKRSGEKAKSTDIIPKMAEDYVLTYDNEDAVIKHFNDSVQAHYKGWIDGNEWPKRLRIAGKGRNLICSSIHDANFKPSSQIFETMLKSGLDHVEGHRRG